MKRNGPSSVASADAARGGACASIASTAYLSFGANLGDRRATMRRAIEWLAAQPAISLDPTRDVARLYETAPIGCDTDQPAYLNTAVRVRTSLSPHQLLQLTRELERTLGRVRTTRNEARLIDVDILLYDSLVQCDTELTLPHPRLVERRFVLEPLADLAPGTRLPNAEETAAEAAERARHTLSDQCIRCVAGPDWAATPT